MKILYDHQMFSIQKYGGVSKYFCELMKNLPKEDNIKLSILFSDNHYLKEDASFFKKTMLPIPEMNFKGKSLVKNTIYQINKSYSRHYISKNNFDVFHPTFYDNYFLNIIKKPYVITVHDLTVFKYKDSYLKNDPFRALMEKVIDNASRIIAISQNTKADLCEILKIKETKIDVIYHGFNYQKGEIKENKWGEYILFVGRRSSYKNFSLFIKAISNLLLREKTLRLICVGEPFTKGERSELKELNILNQCCAIAVDENNLNTLYAHALIFVYPSLYEGFGMPILEAFANNCPIALSNTSCFPEIAEDAGIYFDPENEESILEAVSKTIYDNSFKSEKIKLGEERLTHFSWKKAAGETSIVYNKI